MMYFPLSTQFYLHLVKLLTKEWQLHCPPACIFVLVDFTGCYLVLIFLLKRSDGNVLTSEWLLSGVVSGDGVMS